MGFRRGGFDHDPYSSTPESDLHEMYQRGKNKGELKKMPMTLIYIPLHPLHGVVNRGDYPKEELFIHRPDFYWRIGLIDLIQNLDGPHHQKEPHYSRDQRINKLLNKNPNIILKRYPFESMTVGKLREIYEETRQIVNRLVERWNNINGIKPYGRTE